jgi:cytochrome bd-type quinol oxidase subunit 2
MGSSVALFTGLVMTLVVFLLMPEYHERLAGEFVPLFQAIAWATLLVVISVAAFLSQLKGRPWRHIAQVGLVAAVLGVGWNYWPS